MRRRAIAGLLLALAAACSSHQTAAVNPAASAEDTLNRFLQAAADSNLAVMSQTWGTERGPAGSTNTPSDYYRRVAIMQAYLAPNHYRIVKNEPVHNQADQRTLQVEFSRKDCTTIVPITMIRTGQGQWLVYQFDLSQIGTPGRPCTRSQ